MTTPKRPLFCPRCEDNLSDDDLDWWNHRATCSSCEHEFALEGYLEHPDRSRIEAVKACCSGTVIKPKTLKIKRTAAPGVESFHLGGALSGTQIRVERDGIVSKRILGLESKRPIEEIRGFGAFQHIPLNATSSDQTTWHVVVLTTDGSYMRLWEFDDRESARFLAKELGKAFEMMRES